MYSQDIGTQHQPSCFMNKGQKFDVKQDTDDAEREKERQRGREGEKKATYLNFGHRAVNLL